jgi:hypothetical protein
MTTLPTVARHAPDAYVLWLDAHGDFNTPGTTTSGFLGGMCLAAACGRWDSGLTEDRLDPAQVILCGARDLDEEESALLEDAGVRTSARASSPTCSTARTCTCTSTSTCSTPRCSPRSSPPTRPVRRGACGRCSARSPTSRTLLGVEITAFEAPSDRAERDALAETIAAIVDPLLAAAVSA